MWDPVSPTQQPRREGGAGYVVTSISGRLFGQTRQTPKGLCFRFYKFVCGSDNEACSDVSRILATRPEWTLTWIMSLTAHGHSGAGHSLSLLQKRKRRRRGVRESEKVTQEEWRSHQQNRRDVQPQAPPFLTRETRCLRLSLPTSWLPAWHCQWWGVHDPQEAACSASRSSGCLNFCISALFPGIGSQWASSVTSNRHVYPELGPHLRYCDTSQQPSLVSIFNPKTKTVRAGRSTCPRENQTGPGSSLHAAIQSWVTARHRSC